MPSSSNSPLAALIAQLAPHNGSHSTAISGLYLTRSSTTEAPRNTLNHAVFCIVAQGSKSITLNNRRCLYDPHRYLLVSLDLPLIGRIEQACPTHPFLGISLVLDFPEIAALIAELKLSPKPAPALPGPIVGLLDQDLLDAVTRLTRLLHTPADIPVMAPLIRREIYYRLLTSEHSGLLQRMTGENGQLQRIARALEWLRQNAARPIRMAELARQLHMSTSAMHASFRAVTAMSPLQFQKQLRLQSARDLMFNESLDANTAARRVGYASPSQFSREYARFFGQAPLKTSQIFGYWAMPCV